MAVCPPSPACLAKVPLGQLDKLIDIRARNIGSAVSNSLKFDEFFTLLHNVPAKVETVSGLAVFGESNQIRAVTHIFTVCFVTDLNIDTWVNFKGRDFDIIDIENLAEQDLFLKIRCSERGVDTLPVNRI